MNDNNIEESRRSAWNYKYLTGALIIGIILQSLFLPCLCQTGEAKIKFAFLFDVLAVIRIIVSKLLNHKDNGWIFYVVLIYSSPFWIELGSWIITGRH